MGRPPGRRSVPCRLPWLLCCRLCRGMHQQMGGSSSDSSARLGRWVGLQEQRRRRRDGDGQLARPREVDWQANGSSASRSQWGGDAVIVRATYGVHRHTWPDTAVPISPPLPSACQSAGDCTAVRLGNTLRRLRLAMADGRCPRARRMTPQIIDAPAPPAVSSRDATGTGPRVSLWCRSPAAPAHVPDPRRPWTQYPHNSLQPSRPLVCGSWATDPSPKHPRRVSCVIRLRLAKGQFCGLSVCELKYNQDAGRGDRPRPSAPSRTTPP